MYLSRLSVENQVLFNTPLDSDLSPKRPILFYMSRLLMGLWFVDVNQSHTP